MSQKERGGEGGRQMDEIGSRGRSKTEHIWQEPEGGREEDGERGDGGRGVGRG